MLPSRYAPSGLSEKDNRKVITSGITRRNNPIEYVIRRIENRINNASSSASNDDIEMLLVDDDEEVKLISQYIQDIRDDSAYQSNEYDMAIDETFENPTRKDNSIAAKNSGLSIYNVGSHGQSVKKHPNYFKEYASYLVIDTNFILLHLNIIDQILLLAEQYRLVIAIPQTVMHELDGLKNSTKQANRLTDGATLGLSGKSMGQLARWANDWIYNALADVNKPVLGQRLMERLDRLAHKDDSILDYCLYLQQFRTNMLVVLLSNDKNLCLKALAHQILTVSFRKGMSGKLIADNIFTEMTQRFGNMNVGDVNMEVKSTVNESSATGNQFGLGNSHNVNYNNMKVPQVAPIRSFDLVASTIYQEVEKVVVHAVKATIHDSYGEDIKLLQGYEPEQVVDLYSASSTILRFWMSVFTEYCRPLRKTSFESVTSHPRNLRSLEEFLDIWGAALSGIYSAVMKPNDIEALDILLLRWHRMIEEIQ